MSKAGDDSRSDVEDPPAEEGDFPTALTPNENYNWNSIHWDLSYNRFKKEQGLNSSQRFVTPLLVVITVVLILILIFH